MELREETLRAQLNDKDMETVLAAKARADAGDTLIRALLELLEDVTRDLNITEDTVKYGYGL